jgi:Flp pilus assembly protein TadD
VACYPLSTELHYLHAVLLLENDRHAEAAQAAQRLVFLDRSLAIGHFLLGSVLRHVGDFNGARRSFRNARDLCARRPVDEAVPLTDGEVAGRLAEAAEVQLAGLG